LVLLSIGTLDSPQPNSPPPLPEFIGAATSRIYHGAPEHQPDLTAASQKSDGGTAEGSTVVVVYRLTSVRVMPDVYFKTTNNVCALTSKDSRWRSLRPRHSGVRLLSTC